MLSDRILELDRIDAECLRAIAEAMETLRRNREEREILHAKLLGVVIEPEKRSRKKVESSAPDMHELREAFDQVRDSFEGKSLEIMECLLATSHGIMEKFDLESFVWPDECKPNTRKTAICRLNKALKKIGMSYAIRSTRTGLVKILKIL